MKIVAFALIGFLFLPVAFADDIRGLERNQDASATVAEAAETAADLHRTPFLNGTYRALIVGNNGYRDPKGNWQPLKTAKQDAITVAEILKSSYGFTDVTLLTDASNREIILAFQELALRTSREDSVLVYYAGHGYLDEANNRGYWIPVDAVGSDITTFIRNSAIRDEIQTLAEKAHHTLLISDSCFSGSLLRGGNRGTTIKEDGDHYYEKTARKKSVQIFAAGGLEFVDDDYRNSGHSPFTYFLINELNENKRPLLSMNEITTNVVKAVANNVNQTPEVGVLYGAGDELGEFIFARVTGSAKITITVDTTSAAKMPTNPVAAVPEIKQEPAKPWAPMVRF